MREFKDDAPISPFVFGTRSGQSINSSNVNAMVKKYAEKVGIEKNVYNHLLRYTALTDLYANTKDIRNVQQIAGHASIQTTEIYTHISPEEIRES